jgi:hypothetical protein
VPAPVEHPAADAAGHVLARPHRPLLRDPGARVLRPGLSPPRAGFVAGVQPRDQAVVPRRLDERQVGDDPGQKILGQGLDRPPSARLVHSLALADVPPPAPLEDGVARQAGDRRPVPPTGPRPRAGRDPLRGEPVGHLGVGGAVLEPAEPFLVHRLGGRVLDDIVVGLRPGRLDVAVLEGLDDAALLEAVPERPADPLRRVLIAGLVLEAGEEGTEPPVVAGGVDRVVDGDQAGAGILAVFAEVDGAVAAADPAEVLDDDEVIVAGLDGRLGVGQVLAVEDLAAAPALDHSEVDRSGVAITDVALAEGGLVVQAAFVLVDGADPDDDEDAQHEPAAGPQDDPGKNDTQGKTLRTRTTRVPATEVDATTIAVRMSSVDHPREGE